MFPRNPYSVTNIDDVREMVLADLSSLSIYNYKYKYLLNVVDNQRVLLKDKTATSITIALISLFQNRKQITIHSDKGAEFVNVPKSQGMNFHTTHNPDIKVAIIEHFNRTLKTKMYK
jgi:hypothetical protein